MSKRLAVIIEGSAVCQLKNGLYSALETVRGVHDAHTFHPQPRTRQQTSLLHLLRSHLRHARVKSERHVRLRGLQRPKIVR